MKQTVLAPAKINLSLDVGSLMPNGYHPVTTVMQTVSLYDEVTVSLEGSGICLTCSDASLPCDQSNTVWRAVSLFEQAYGNLGGVTVHIQKNIPMQAGLAGGSSDAAAALKALNRLTGSPFSQDRLCAVAANIGADVPFCLVGGTQLATGIGTELSPLPSMPSCFVVLAKPSIGISTKEAYRAIDSALPSQKQDTPAVVAALQKGSLSDLAAAVGNRFEQVLPLSEVEYLRTQMLRRGALCSHMSGSGSAVFALFEEERAAQACLRDLADLGFCALCRPVG